MGVSRKNNPKYRKGKDSLNRDAWLLRSSDKDHNGSGLRSGIAGIAAQGSHNFEKFLSKQESEIRKRIADVIGVPATIEFRSESLTVNDSSQGSTVKVSSAVEADVVIATQAGDIHLRCFTGASYERKGRGLPLQSRWVHLSYNNQGIIKSGDLEGMLSPLLAEGLRELSPAPRRAKRDQRKERKRLKRGGSYAARQTQMVGDIAAERFGVRCTNITFDENSYTERDEIVRGRWRATRRLSGVVALQTGQGEVMLSVEIFEIRRRTEFGTVNEFTQVRFLAGENEVWSRRELLRLVR